MHHLLNISRKDDGYILVVALLVMAILSLLGIAGMNTSIFETQVAGNDWNAKRTFYRADGGISVGSELLEQNFNCPIGFKGAGQTVIEGFMLVKERGGNTMAFAINPPFSSTNSIVDKLNAPNNNYDAAYPSDSNGVLPALDVGYLFFGGQTQVLPGGALQMAAGYEGKGKSSGQGGVAKIIDIYSQFFGPKSSEAIIVSGWRHLVGSEGSCIY